MPVAYCRFCGQPLVSTSDHFCRECGGDQGQAMPTGSLVVPVRSTGTLDTIPNGYPASLVCANCGNADVRSVASLYKEGNVSGVSQATSQTQTYIPADANHYGHINYGTMQTTTAVTMTSELAALLAPPQPPSRQFASQDYLQSSTALMVTLMVLGGLGYSLLSIAIQPVDYFFTGVLIVPLAGLALWGINTLWRNEEAENERRSQLAWQGHCAAMESHARMMIGWSRLHYCGRCDCVTDPETETFAQSSRWRVLFRD